MEGHVVEMTTLAPRHLLLCLCRLFLRTLGERCSLAENLQRLHHDGIVLVDVLMPGVLVEHVVDDARVDVSLKQLVRLLNKQVTTLQAMIVAIDGKFLYHVLLVQIV